MNPPYQPKTFRHHDRALCIDDSGMAGIIRRGQLYYVHSVVMLADGRQLLGLWESAERDGSLIGANRFLRRRPSTVMMPDQRFFDGSKLPDEQL